MCEYVLYYIRKASCSSRGAKEIRIFIIIVIILVVLVVVVVE